MNDLLTLGGNVFVCMCNHKKPTGMCAQNNLPPQKRKPATRQSSEQSKNQAEFTANKLKTKQSLQYSFQSCDEVTDFPH